MYRNHIFQDCPVKSHDGPSANEVTLNDMGIRNHYLSTTKYKKVRIVCIILSMQYTYLQDSETYGDEKVTSNGIYLYLHGPLPYFDSNNRQNINNVRI